VSQLPGRWASISAGLAWARCAASAASTAGIGLARAGPIWETEAAGGILRRPGGAWSPAGGAAGIGFLSIARAILTARMRDKARREVRAAAAGWSPRLA
jgi:hypothetical protein